MIELVRLFAITHQDFGHERLVFDGLHPLVDRAKPNKVEQGDLRLQPLSLHCMVQLSTRGVSRRRLMAEGASMVTEGACLRQQHERPALAKLNRKELRATSPYR
jgi:hypothetical protein